MTTGSAPLHRAIFNTWDTNVHSTFSQYWAEGVRDNHLSLLETLGDPAQPFPYCVVDIDNGALIGKTTGKGAVADPAVAISYQMHDVPVMFKVYSRQIGSRNWDAKTASIQVAARVKEVFGGHPTSKPVAMSMDPGSIVLQRFERDYGSRLDENVHCWHLEYLFKIDNQFAH